MGLLTPCFVPRGGFLYTMGERVLLPSSRVPGVCPRGGGMVLDEIDTCITFVGGFWARIVIQAYSEKLILRIKGGNCDGTDFTMGVAATLPDFKMGIAATFPELSEWTLLTYSQSLIFRFIPFYVKVYILQDLAFRAEVRVDFIPLLY